jgi:hypothetical protein
MENGVRLCGCCAARPRRALDDSISRALRQLRAHRPDVFGG